MKKFDVMDTVTYPPISPPTQAPINTLVCNTNSNSIQCIICGEGQGIGPVLSGKYGSASFTACFNSIILVAFSLLSFTILFCKFINLCKLSLRGSRRRKSISLDVENGGAYSSLLDNDYNPYEDPQQEVSKSDNDNTNNTKYDNNNLTTHNFNGNESNKPPNVYDVGLHDFASAYAKNVVDIEKKTTFPNDMDNGNVEVKQNGSPTAKKNTNASKTSYSNNNSGRSFSAGKAAGPLLRGSRSYATSIREVLELEMKKKEGWIVPQLQD